jgi:transposase
MTRKLTMPKKGELRAMYEREGVSISQVARHYNTTNPTVRKWLDMYEIPRKSHQQASAEANRSRAVRVPTKENFQENYDRMSIKELETHYGIGQATIYEWIEELGIAKRTLSDGCTMGKVKQFEHIQFSKEHLESLYDGSRPLTAVADDLGVSYSHVKKLFREHQIPVESATRSKAEIEIFEYCETIRPGWVANDRNVIAPLEIDIFHPELKLAIEYCGSYWHSETFGGRNSRSHKDKFNKCRECGIRLITVFEGDDKEKVKAIIRTMIGQNDRIFARKCTIKDIKASEARLFHDAHHLSGFAPAGQHHALVSPDGETVMVASFGKSRYRKDVEMECVRMTSHSNYSVVGGASKLFKHALRDHQSCVTYADLRFGEGNVYEHCGFEYSGETAPNYWYFHRNRPELYYSRVKFQKHKLPDLLDDFDADLTEYQNMLNNRYDRIWDCGNGIWLWRR